MLRTYNRLRFAATMVRDGKADGLDPRHAPAVLHLIKEHAALQALAARVAALNPHAGEIGPGMLRSLVEAARQALDNPTNGS